MKTKNIPMKPKPKSITVLGRRWFEKTNGNTYHSVRVLVDGVRVHTCDFAYGYGEQYLWSAQTWLKYHGYLRGVKEGDRSPDESLWRYCERRKIAFYYDVTDVTRKRDL